jgi:2-succinyl-5-enolpyruvyl-6-hydroxy-3-cyclohexene-1-carboxylate synthase
MSASNLHTRWSHLLVRSLVKAGAREFVISPGSRSTPLALAAAQEEGARCHASIDERSAAFFALGQARLTGAPSVLICTSGTAVAHYLPALIEANLCGLPLIALTADRPWEAYDAASSQTIDQVKLFGGYVRHYAEIGLPDAAPEALRAVVRIAAQAVQRSRSPWPGPVHLNARFRKPLEPVDAGPEPWTPTLDALLQAGPPLAFSPEEEPSREALALLRRALSEAQRPVLVAGPAFGAVESRGALALWTLSAHTGAPLLVEATSLARFVGSSARPLPLCGSFDSLLRSPAFRKKYAPDLVLEFGMPPVSASYAAWMSEHAHVPRYVIAPQGWNDPLGTARGLVFAHPARVAELLKESAAPPSDAVFSWSRAFSQKESRAWEIVEQHSQGPLCEGSIARLLLDAVPSGTALLVGNSNPVRDLDTYCRPRAKQVTVLHQRGASGIDGLVSGAAGSKSVFAGPLVLFLGDISLLHDLGGLNLARMVKGPLVIVVVQNDGGRIFEQLPLGKRSELAPLVASHFVMPQGLPLAPAAQLFGLVYHRAETQEAFAGALSRALAHDGATLIEAIAAPDSGARRAALWRALSSLAEENP